MSESRNLYLPGLSSFHLCFYSCRASKKPEVGQKECNGATVEHRNKKISKHKAVKWANGIDELLLDKRKTCIIHFISLSREIESIWMGRPRDVATGRTE